MAKLLGGSGQGVSMDTHDQHQRTPPEGCSAPGSDQLSPALRWNEAGSNPTDPASPRMEQAGVYSVLMQSHQIWPYSPPWARMMHLEMQQRFTAQPGACSYLHAFKGRLGQTLMAKSQNTAPAFLGLLLCFSLRDLIQIKASQTQGFPSFSAGVNFHTCHSPGTLPWLA